MGSGNEIDDGKSVFRVQGFLNKKVNCIFTRLSLNVYVLLFNCGYFRVHVEYIGYIILKLLATGSPLPLPNQSDLSTVHFDRTIPKESCVNRFSSLNNMFFKHQHWHDLECDILKGYQLF